MLRRRSLLAAAVAFGLAVTASFAAPQSEELPTLATGHEGHNSRPLWQRPAGIDLGPDRPDVERVPQRPAPPSDNVPSSPSSDADRDRIEDFLEDHLGTMAEGETVLALVQFLPYLDEDGLQALRDRHGGFNVTSFWPHIRGFAGHLTEEDIVGLAQDPDIRQVWKDHGTCAC